MGETSFDKYAEIVEKYKKENQMKKVIGWKPSQSNHNIVLIETDEGIVPVKSSASGFISILQPWAKDFKKLCDEYVASEAETAPETIESSPSEQETSDNESIPHNEPVEQEYKSAPQQPYIPQQPYTPQEAYCQSAPPPYIPQPPYYQNGPQQYYRNEPAPAYMTWAEIDRSRKGVLPSFLNISGAFFLFIALRLFFNDETVVVGLFAIPIALVVWLILGGISSLIRSLRTIETYEANIYKQTRALNQRD